MISRHRGSSTKSSTGQIASSRPLTRNPRQIVQHRRQRCRGGGWCLFLALTVVVCYIHRLGGTTSDHSSADDGEYIVSDAAADGIFTAFTSSEERKLKLMRKNFQQLKNSNALVPCRIDEDCQSTQSSRDISAWLRRSFLDANAKLVLRNTLPFHRYICGQAIWGGGGTLELEGSEIVRCLAIGLPYVNSPGPPPVSGRGLKPVELFWNYGKAYRSRSQNFVTEEFPCPVPCRKFGDFSILSVVSIKDTNWEILSTMEGERYYRQAKVGRKSYLNNQFYATTSFQSEIPLPYFSWAEYNIQHAAVDFDKSIKGASFMANNCDSNNKREELVLALMASQLRVDSLSSCHHNAEPPPGVKMHNKTAVQEQYLLYLAFENQNADDYITEKLWGALAAGTLPVYLGAPNIKDHVPPNSIVVVDDFPSTKELADYLIRLTKDKALYESYHAWRYQPIDPHFKEKFEFTKTHSTCRMCKWVHSRKHGFSWDHARQEAANPHILHKTCRNKMGLIGHPFKEYWSVESGESAVSVQSDVGTKTCSLDSSNRILQIDGGVFRRKVFDQDGITDLIIDRVISGASYQLKLETPISSSAMQSIEEDNGKTWWLQDGASRITMIFSEPVKPALASPGVVQLVVASSLRIRVIVEDLDLFHKGANKHQSYFAEIMKRDFFTPIEAHLR